MSYVGSALRIKTFPLKVAMSLYKTKEKLDTVRIILDLERNQKAALKVILKKDLGLEINQSSKLR